MHSPPQHVAKEASSPNAWDVRAIFTLTGLSILASRS